MLISAGDVDNEDANACIANVDTLMAEMCTDATQKYLPKIDWQGLISDKFKQNTPRFADEAKIRPEPELEGDLVTLHRMVAVFQIFLSGPIDTAFAYHDSTHGELFGSFLEDLLE